MSPQLTLQTPLELPPSEVPHYLDQLWSRDQASSIGAHTFCLLIWQPAWVEQQLVRTGRIEGPIMGVQRDEVEEAMEAMKEKIEMLEKSLAANAEEFRKI